MKRTLVISGLFFPLTMMHYFINAFEELGEDGKYDIITVGPFSNNYIPWNGGMYLDEKYVRVPTLPLPQDLRNADPQIVETRIDRKVDLWIQFDAGFHFMRRPASEVCITVGTDPHVLNEFYDLPRMYSDKFYNMQRSYLKSNDLFLPYAFDDTIHKPLSTEKEYDGCLIGLQYQQRCELVNALEQTGYNIYYGIGEVYDQFVKSYNKAKVALNWSSLLDLNARTFEAMGMRLPLLTNRIPALNEFFEEGTHYLGFGDVEEAVRQFDKLIYDETMSKEMAKKAYDLVAKNHTYKHRVREILKGVGWI